MDSKTNLRVSRLDRKFSRLEGKLSHSLARIIALEEEIVKIKAAAAEADAAAERELIKKACAVLDLDF
jgi:hypothetical protein